ncbi:hypothetical protein EDC04DRAFT_2688462 [Pisolithus marmoratus]|nr:hypothetical protein EDC04DRAFT_2688462 [Pisolithus marmoratus]
MPLGRCSASDMPLRNRTNPLPAATGHTLLVLLLLPQAFHGRPRAGGHILGLWSGLGYDIANNIGRIARVFGCVTTFKAYLDISTQPSRSTALRSELQLSGVSVVDCPHNGKKDVVDKMAIGTLMKILSGNTPLMQ